MIRIFRTKNRYSELNTIIQNDRWIFRTKYDYSERDTVFRNIIRIFRITYNISEHNVGYSEYSMYIQNKLHNSE